jgi:ribosomal protein S18 acetylase RimI-like enzyme
MEMMNAELHIQSRAYRGDADLHPIKEFLMASAGTRPPHTYWHIGNLLWSMFYDTHYDACRDLRIWEDDRGSVLGFAWFDEPNTVELQVAPHLRGQGSLEVPMLAWAAEHARTFQQPDEPRLWTRALDNDAEYGALLLGQGFERGEALLVRMLQELDRPLPAAPLPAGWTVRHVGGEDEYEARVDLHREVWQPSRSTLEAYRWLRAAPGYRPELDLVAVAPDGTFASYCICWLDPVNKIGLFEPVGTRPAYRRQGLSTAVIIEGLRRLQAYGARTAFVSTGAQNDPAIKLYESTGFRIVSREYRYSRKL